MLYKYPHFFIYIRIIVGRIDHSALDVFCLSKCNKTSFLFWVKDSRAIGWSKPNTFGVTSVIGRLRPLHF